MKCLKLIKLPLSITVPSARLVYIKKRVRRENYFPSTIMKERKESSSIFVSSGLR